MTDASLTRVPPASFATFVRANDVLNMTQTQWAGDGEGANISEDTSCRGDGRKEDEEETVEMGCLLIDSQETWRIGVVGLMAFIMNMKSTAYRIID